MRSASSALANFARTRVTASGSGSPLSRSASCGAGKRAPVGLWTGASASGWAASESAGLDLAGSALPCLDLARRLVTLALGKRAPTGPWTGSGSSSDSGSASRSVTFALGNRAPARPTALFGAGAAEVGSEAEGWEESCRTVGEGRSCRLAGRARSRWLEAWGESCRTVGEGRVRRLAGWGRSRGLEGCEDSR